MPWIAEAIQNGLAPQCAVSGFKSTRNLPVYEDDGDEPIAFVHPAVHNDESYKYCIYCGTGRLYPADLIDANGVCTEHQGEIS